MPTKDTNPPPPPRKPLGDETGRTVALGHRPLMPGLYIVSTPIGNLADITLRALETLFMADVIACEDTRTTGKLAAHFGISTPRVAYHDHNGPAMRPKLLARLDAGEAVALVSDAGTPLVSDPGMKLVTETAAVGHGVTAIPGPSAVLFALAVAGLPTDRFLFAGFLPQKSGARRKTLAELADIPATLILYESGPRLAASLADMAALLGDRPAAVIREATKLHEETMRGTLGELAARYQMAEPPRGEITLIAGPPGQARPAAVDLDALLAAALAGATLKQAVADVTAETGLPRKTVYARALDLKT